MDFDRLKKQVDAIANIVKSIEEPDPSAVVLPTLQRSPRVIIPGYTQITPHSH